MSPMKRITRDRYLTSEEAEAEKLIRDQIDAEYGQSLFRVGDKVRCIAKPELKGSVTKVGAQPVTSKNQRDQLTITLSNGQTYVASAFEPDA